MATVAPAGIRRLTPSQRAARCRNRTDTSRNSISPRTSREVHGGSGGAAIVGCSCRISSMRSSEAVPRCIRFTTQPERDHRPDQHAHVGVEHDEAADRDPSGQHLRAADPEHRQERQADQGLAAAGMKMPCVRASLIFCAMYSRLSISKRRSSAFSCAIGPDHAHAGEVLLHAAADIGKHRLDPLEARVDRAAEHNHDKADDRRRQRARQTPARQSTQAMIAMARTSVSRSRTST